MEKYKLINIKTNEQHLCDKVTIDGYDYYVSNDEVIIDGTICYFQGLNKIDIVQPTLLFDDEGNIEDEYIDRDFKLAVIATNNPTIDIPKVVDEVETLAIEYNKNKFISEFNPLKDKFAAGIITGWKQSQETHPYSDEDIIDFWNKSLNIMMAQPSKQFTVEKLLQLWKDEKSKIVYYE